MLFIQNEIVEIDNISKPGLFSSVFVTTGKNQDSVRPNFIAEELEKHLNSFYLFWGDSARVAVYTGVRVR